MPSPTGPFRSLANPNYRLWASGAIVSNIGTPVVWWDLISDGTARTGGSGYNLTDLSGTGAVTYDATKPFTHILVPTDFAMRDSVAYEGGSRCAACKSSRTLRIGAFA